MNKLKLSVLLFVLLFGYTVTSKAQDGEKIFKTTCSACHSIGKGKVVGPDLKDVANRHEESWILKWVKSSQTLVKGGDAAAVKLFNENSMIPMPDQTLSDEEIKSVLAYIKVKGAEAATAKTAAVAATDQANDQQNGNLLTSLGFGGYLSIMIGGFFLVIIWVMNLMIKKFSLDLKEQKMANHS